LKKCPVYWFLDLSTYFIGVSFEEDKVRWGV
jgi:hypothetical protein